MEAFPEARQVEERDLAVALEPLDVRGEVLHVRRISVREEKSPRALVTRAVEVKRSETQVRAVDVHLDEAGTVVKGRSGHGGQSRLDEVCGRPEPIGRDWLGREVNERPRRTRVRAARGSIRAR